MATLPPNLQSERSALPLTPKAAEVLLNAALAAHRAGALDDLLTQRVLVTRWVARRLLRPVLGTAGDLARDDLAQASAWLLVWLAQQLRPDREAGLENIGREAWLDRTSWRPLLAVLCHHGFLSVPDFPDRYRRRPDESAADNLCGLWSLGPSTFYRYLDKGKRLMVKALVSQPMSGERRLSLRRSVQLQLQQRWVGRSAADQAAWHRSQAQDMLARRDHASMLWHLTRAGDVDGFIRAIHGFRVELASDRETDALIDCVRDEGLTPRQRFDLCLAEAELWRTRKMHDRERQSCEQALAAAVAAQDKLMLGIVYGALGKFHEPRDTDKAFACFEDSAEFLREAGAEDHPVRPEVLQAYVASLQKLASFYVVRNDPRSKAVLERIATLRSTSAIAPELVALVEMTWGAYCRRAGELKRAVEHTHRALNISERLGDTRQILATYTNLSVLYMDAKEYDRAVQALQNVLALGSQFSIEPQIWLSTRLNLGAAFFFQGRYDLAIREYQVALEESVRANMPVMQNRAHYNLAEAYYKRFQAAGDAADEREGDLHAAAAIRAEASAGDSRLQDAARTLKTEILGAHDGLVLSRMLPEEFSAHFDEMSDVQRQRAVLAVPLAADAHVQAHLAIARAYLSIATKEREAALALIQKHRLGDRFASEFEQLRSTFNRELTREQQLASRWAQAAGELLQEQRRIALLDHLFRAGSIQKSIYAQVCGVGLATASKHLATLAERGLLEQTGKGPSTRYVLPH